ncbi:MAG: general secretion pathway protein GspB [Oleiphilaceae bacterium]|nr:general secretion pathway protein GspB [Oleiphilaceae bacterium]
MSYILDALRKSEQERNQSRVVDNPSAAPMMMGRHGRSGGAWWIWPLVVLNLSVLGYLYWHNGYNTHAGAGAADRAPVVTDAPSSSYPSQSGKNPVVADNRAPVSEPASAPGSQWLERSTATDEAADSGERLARQPPDSSWDTRLDTSVQEEALATGPLPEDASGSNSGPFQPSGSGQPHDGSASSRTSPEAPRQASATGPRDDRVARDGVPLLVDMSPAFRRQVPDLVFNSHVYSSSPESRRVIINQQYLAEGDRVGPMRLLEITPGGVILSLNDTPFAVPVVHDWIQRP